MMMDLRGGAPIGGRKRAANSFGAPGGRPKAPNAAASTVTRGRRQLIHTHARANGLA